MRISDWSSDVFSSDLVHLLRFARLLSALVDDGQRGVVEPLGEGARTHHAAHVGRGDRSRSSGETRLDVGGHDRRAVEISGRDIEEALYPSRMEVDRKAEHGADHGATASEALGRNRRAGPGLSVLPRIRE